MYACGLEEVPRAILKIDGVTCFELSVSSPAQKMDFFVLFYSQLVTPNFKQSLDKFGSRRN